MNDDIAPVARGVAYHCDPDDDTVDPRLDIVGGRHARALTAAHEFVIDVPHRRTVLRAGPTAVRPMNAVKTVTVTPAQERFADWMRDVLVYTVVLNLFVEFADAIVIDSFLISIFTAVVLKILLDLLTLAEHHVSHFFSKIHKVLGFLSMWAVLFLSKFVILEVIDIIFGDHVELGKLLDVILLVLALMISRVLVQKAYDALGVTGADEGVAPVDA